MKIVANNYKASELIKLIRETTNLTQKEFGAKLNRSRDSINNLENNRNGVNFDDFLDICNKFGFKITIEEVKEKEFDIIR